MPLIRNSLAVAAVVLLGACATQAPEQPGHHLVVRDLGRTLLMQFDYPTDELCARTAKAMRGSIYQAGCSTVSAADALRSQATLRYNPPGVLVQGHYTDLSECQKQTSQLATGVELITACRGK